ncbi:MAG: LysR family transcriptional regulator [Spirochaetaceae bacterium]|nr:LysR family transcriptional regulator [Spirochaetaceae bacterium]
MDIEFLELRAAVFREIRSFFDKKDFLEVDTPILAPDLIPETCLEVFRTEYLVPGGKPGGPYWLVPSPEIWMKKLIATHGKSVYQICRCFRNGESTGFLHSPEFTMLEYYTVGFDYLDSLELTEELFGALWQAFPLGEGSRSPGRGRGFLRISVEDAFREFAGVDLFGAAEAGQLGEEARRLGLETPDDLDIKTVYDLIFIHAVEPRLPKDTITALLDYPAFVPCLAKQSPDGKTVERWEIYGHGVELANCYSEETDAETVRRYFEEEGEAKARTALAPHRIDGNYWKLFAGGPGKRPFPKCSGVAMGLDRLIMVLTGRSAIDSVLPFPMEAGSKGSWKQEAGAGVGS